MDILVITGPPYSGKGTQCEILKDFLGYVHVSTGDRCRLEKANNTEVGKIMCLYEEKGDLVPDSVMKKMFGQIIDENLTQNGIILDGFPRTIPQVDDLIELVISKGLKISRVINIEVPKEELLKRANKRAETSTRKDDKDAQIHLKRLEVFEAITRHSIDYMKTKLTVSSFDGLGNIQEITNKIKKSL